VENLVLVSKVVITPIYLICLLFLCGFGLHRYYLTRLFTRYKKVIPKPRAYFRSLPKVTIQLPIYNEQYVVERIIKSVCEIEYPKELLEIQVLDDSTDRTIDIANKIVEKFSSSGFNICYIHRDCRVGFKAGALSEGLLRAEGDYIAIFDADFIPPRDFLKETINYFTDPKVGIVQARWAHLNLNYSTLTKAQSILLDGHFLIEQSSRFYGGMFFNFNGTAGVLRKECIQSVGGWQHDTLTEDLDLSYRAQLEGWRLIYLKDIIAKAELPVDMNAFKSQQHRWAKGGIQTAKKLLPRVFRSKKLSLSIKTEAAFHLLGNFSYILLLLLIVFMAPMGYFWRSYGWENIILLNLIAVSSGTLSIVRFYLIAVREIHKDEWTNYVKYIPLAMAIGTGLVINNSKAVLEALLGKSSDFRRTPKFAVTNEDRNWHKGTYNTQNEFSTLVELGLGIIFIILTFYAVFMGLIGWIPFLILIQIGFIYTSVLSILHSLPRKRV
jgi:cellulose synthase/poly-beta-1,6-N-acetylglucosamine synthase-like glycosyltransferase